VYELYYNTYSVPRTKCLVQIIILDKENINKEEFTSKCTEICRNFIDYKLKTLLVDYNEYKDKLYKFCNISVDNNAENTLNEVKDVNTENTNAETTKNSTSEAFIEPEPSIMGFMLTYQQIRNRARDDNIIDDKIIVTHNDHESIDFDVYYVKISFYHL